MPLSPKSPKSPGSNQARPTLEGIFGDLGIGGNKSEGKKKAREVSEMSSVSAATLSMRDSFRRKWPPALDFGSEFEFAFDESSISSVSKVAATHSLRPSSSLVMSNHYRETSDNWGKNPAVLNTPLDKSDDFNEVKTIMDDIQEHCERLQQYRDDAADFMVEEMVKMIFGSSKKAKRCTDLNLDETLRLCRQIFAGEAIEYSERTPEYKTQMERIVRSGIDAGSDHIIRSRREMVQHAAAFHFIVRRFVHEYEPMTEDLIKQTHEILVAGIGAGSAGYLSNKEYGGRYRTDKVFVGVQEAPAANTIPASMASLVRKLEADINEANKAKQLDPFALAAKYCTMFVHIHPFQDANGRMCRLLMNAILIKYTGIVVSLGEHDQDRDEYIETATQSRDEGGHPGGLSTLILQKAKETLGRMRGKVLKKR